MIKQSTNTTKLASGSSVEQWDVIAVGAGNAAFAAAVAARAC